MVMTVMPEPWYGIEVYDRYCYDGVYWSDHAKTVYLGIQPFTSVLQVPFWACSMYGSAG